MCYQFTLAKNAASLQPYYLSVPKGIGGIQLYLNMHGLHLNIQRAFQALHPVSARCPPVLSLMKNRLMEIQLVVCVEYRTSSILFKYMVL